jgi:hypothetical protein
MGLYEAAEVQALEGVQLEEYKEAESNEDRKVRACCVVRVSPFVRFFLCARVYEHFSALTCTLQAYSM